MGQFDPCSATSGLSFKPAGLPSCDHVRGSDNVPVSPFDDGARPHASHLPAAPGPNLPWADSGRYRSRRLLLLNPDSLDSCCMLALPNRIRRPRRMPPFIRILGGFIVAGLLANAAAPAKPSSIGDPSPQEVMAFAQLLEIAHYNRVRSDGVTS